MASSTCPPQAASVSGDSKLSAITDLPKPAAQVVAQAHHVHDDDDDDDMGEQGVEDYFHEEP